MPDSFAFTVGFFVCVHIVCIALNVGTTRFFVIRKLWGLAIIPAALVVFSVACILGMVRGL